MYNNFRPRAFSYLPPAVKNLLIINGLFFLATMSFDAAFKIDLGKVLGLHYWTSPDFRIWQPITHMFMHADFGHIISNMFAMWMFGTAIENVWGPKRFIFFYIFTALGAAVLHQTVNGIEIFRIQNAIEAFTTSTTIDNFVRTLNLAGLEVKNTTLIAHLQSIYPDGVITQPEAGRLTNQLMGIVSSKLTFYSVGASGAVFGILTAFALYFPNTELFLLFIPFPIKAKYFVIMYAILELYLGVQNNPNDSVAHFAHLGGALVGFLVVKFWNKSNRKTLY